MDPLKLDTRDAAEILSLMGTRDDLGRRVVVSVARWFGLPAPGGGQVFAPTAAGPGVPLDEAARAIAAEARQVLAREQGGQGHEQAEDQAGGVHSATVAPAARAGQVA